MTRETDRDPEEPRIAALHDYGILDTPREECFDRLVEMAAHACAAPMAAIVFVDRRRQWVKAVTGLDLAETPRDASFGELTLHSDGPLVVPDTLQDARFRGVVFAPGGPEVRFYAGAPLLSPEGHPLGALCVMDTRPRQPEARQVSLLESLARQVVNQLELHRERLRLEQAVSQCGAALAEVEAGRRDLALAQRVARMGSWVLNIPENQLRWSDEIHRIFGTEPEGFGGTFESFFAFVHPHDRAALMAAQRRAERGEAPLDLVHRILRADGTVGVVHERAELVPDEDGRLNLLAGTVQDITQEREAAHAREEQQALIRMAVRVAGLGGWEVHLDEDRIAWSDEVCRIHGMPPGSSPTVEQAIRFYPEPDRTRIRTLVQACVERGEAFDEELQIETAHGERRWVRAAGEPVRDEAGRIVRLRGAFQDIDARKRAEEERHSLAERLQSTLEQMSDAFVMVDREWQIRFVNREAERVVRRSGSELVGQTLWDAFPGTRGSVFERQHRWAVEQGRAVEYEAFYEPLNLWVEVRAHPTSDGLAIYFRDIGERRAAQERLRLLEACVARMNDVLLVTEAESLDEPGPQIVFVNDAFERVTGYTAAEVRGRSPRLLQGERTDRAELDRIRHALERHRPVRAEVVNYTKAGGEFWVELDISPVTDDSGHTTHLVAVQRDITVRKAYESRLREQAALLEQARDAIIVRDLEHRIRYWNRGAEASYGWRADEVLGQSVVTLLYDDPAPFHAAMREVLEHGEWTGVLTHRCRNEQQRTMQCHWSLMRGDAGEARAVLAINTDVTEKRQLQSRLQMAQRLETVGQLTGGVAHDFNNLLTIIQGNAELLAEGPLESEATRASAELIQQAAQRGAQLTQRLLAFARRQTLTPEVLDVNAQLTDVEPLLRRTLPDDVELTLDLRPDLWRAYVDAAQFEACVVNLVINARDALPRGGRVTVETSNVTVDALDARDPELLPGDYCQVAVSDTGEGIPAELLPRVFDPFFTTKAAGKGTGMGLSMVYGFMRQSGGHVRIYSELGLGTTVRLYLPRAGATEIPAPERGREPPAGVPADGQQVLVVEDDAMVRRLAVGLLRSLGYRVLECASGADALEILRSPVPVELLFTDVVMPGGMNGRELADAARQLRPQLKVLFTSGYTEDAIIQSGRLDPGVHLLEKPYGRRALARKLRDVLGSADNGNSSPTEGGS